MTEYPAQIKRKYFAFHSREREREKKKTPTQGKISRPKHCAHDVLYGNQIKRSGRDYHVSKVAVSERVNQVR